MSQFVTITKEEFEEAKAGKIVILGFTINRRGKLAYFVLSNGLPSEDRIHGILANGYDVYPIDVSELRWEQISNPHLNQIPNIVFEDGTSIILTSEEAIKQIEEADA